MKPSNAAAAMAAACVLCLPGAPAVAQEEPIVVFSRIFVTPGREAEAEVAMVAMFVTALTKSYAADLKREIEVRDRPNKLPRVRVIE